MVNEIDINVHRSGNEDIFGTKNFHSNVIVKNHSMEGFVVSNQEYSIKEHEISQDILVGRYLFTDKNMEWCGSVQETIGSKSDVSLSLIARRLSSIKEDMSFLTVGLLSDGYPFAACPTPSNPQEYSDFIATTKWVSDLIDIKVEKAISELKKELIELINDKK